MFSNNNDIPSPLLGDLDTDYPMLSPPTVQLVKCKEEIFSLLVCNNSLSLLCN